MHELAITQSLLEISLRHAQQADTARIKSLNLVIGELSSIVDDSVQFYWDIISRGTIAEGAQLNFRRIPAALRCEDCAHEFPLDHKDYVCPDCGSSRVMVVAGDDFSLESIDVDLASEVSETSDPN